MQPEIECGRAAGGGQDVAVVDEQDVRFEPDAGEASAEGGRPLPVRGGPAPVENPGLGQGEGAAAKTDQARTACVGPPDGVEHGGTPGDLDVRPVGDDQGVRRVGRLQTDDSGEGEEPVPHQRAGLGRAEPEIVQIAADLGSAQAEDLAGTAQFERVGVLVHDHDDPMCPRSGGRVRGIFRHVRFLALTPAGRNGPG